MNSTSTSIGVSPLRGGNENHDGDPRSKTLGEQAPRDEPPAGAEQVEGAPAPAAPDAPAEAKKPQGGKQV